MSRLRADISKYLARIGRNGGLAKSAAKSAANRRNAKKLRPRKVKT